MRDESMLRGEPMISSLNSKRTYDARRGRHIMAFEIETEGSHPGYIQNLARYWAESEQAGQLDFVVTPLFTHKHPDVTHELSEYGPAGVRLVTMTQAENKELAARRRSRYFLGWDLFCRYAKKLRADHGLLMYFDSFQLPSIVGRRSPCPFSCIYFRPTFHYHTLSNYVPSLGERIKAMRKRWLLTRVLRNPALDVLFCLDPLVVDYLETALRTKKRIVYLPDPVQFHPDGDAGSEQLGRELGIEPGRRIFLLLGCLDQRKGIVQLLESVPLLPRAVCEKVCLLIVGPLHRVQASAVRETVSELRATYPIEIVLRDAFVADHQVQHYYQLADVVLATYQQHMGMSSALVRAGGARKPVLAQDYGLMGEIVRRRDLGRTIDSTKPSEIAQGLREFVMQNPHALFNAENAAEFARENSAERTGHTLFRHLI